MSRLILSFIVFISAINFTTLGREIYNAPAVNIQPGIFAVDTLPRFFNTIDYHLRIEIPRNSSEAAWELTLTYENNSTTVIIIEREGSSTDDVLYGLPLSVKVRNYSPKSELTGFSDYQIIKDIDPACDGWSLTINQNADNTEAICSLGQRAKLLSFPIQTYGLKSITASAESKLRLARLSMFVGETESLASSYIQTYQQLRRALSSSSSQSEGLWRYLDRDTDMRRLNMGANYMLATVCAPDGTIEILYLGQSGNKSALNERWKPLMLKGRLLPTIFMNHYDLIWYDAFGTKIDYETSADIIDGAILKLNFPVQGGSIRFQKSSMASDSLSR